MRGLPSNKSIKQGYTLVKSRYFTATDSFSVETAANRFAQTCLDLMHIMDAVDKLYGGANIDDLDRP